MWWILWTLVSVMAALIIIMSVRQACCAGPDVKRVNVTVTPAPAQHNAGNWSPPGQALYSQPAFYSTGGVYQAAPPNHAVGTNYVTGVYPAAASPYPNIVRVSAPATNAGVGPQVHGSHTYPPPPKY